MSIKTALFGYILPGKTISLLSLPESGRETLTFLAQVPGYATLDNRNMFFMREKLNYEI